MVEYISYESVNGVPFGATEKEVIEVFGEPNSRGDRRGVLILDYKNYAVNFNEEGKFVYFGVHRTAKVTINGQLVGWTLKEVADIIRMDSHPVVDDAYIILRDLGVTFINFHDIEDDDTSDRVMAFFAKGEMEIYDSEQSFKLNDQLENLNNSLHIIDKSETDMKKEAPSTPQNNTIIPDDFMK